MLLSFCNTNIKPLEAAGSLYPTDGREVFLMAKNKSLTFSSSALEKWSHGCGLAFTLTLSDVALVLPDGRMVAGTYAGFPQSHG